MPLGISGQIDRVRGVVDRAGNLRPAATADEQEKTNDRLGNFGDGADGETTDDTTGSTLPAGAVPDGVEIVVQAMHDNDSRVKVGLTDSPTVELKGGTFATFRVEDRSQVHVVAKSDGDGVAFSHEEVA